MQKRKIKIPSNQLRASFKPETYDKERNTIDVVWTTGARVKRWSWFDGPYHEELSLEKGHVKLDRLNAGASLLNNHRAGDLGNVIGVVENASIEKGLGVATVRFSQREDVQGIVDDIKDGIIRNLSVGYDVDKYEELEEEAEDGSPIYRAVDWTPMELSFVTIPADMGAQARSEQVHGTREAIIETKGENMNKKTKKRSDSTSEEVPAEQPAPVAEQPAEQPVPSSEEVPQPAVETPSEAPEAPAAEVPAAVEPSEPSERGTSGTQTQTVDEKEIRAREILRQEEIRKAVRVASLAESFADDLVKKEVTIDQAREAIFKELEKRTSSATVNQRIEVTNMDQQQLRREAAVRGMLHRFDSNKYQLKEGDREFRQGSVLDLARYFLHLEGVREAFTMTKTEVAKRALHSSSDFPEVLANTANKSLRDAYMGAPNTYEAFVAKKSVSDFKEISSVQLGNGGKLMEVDEHGEYKRTTVEESAEKYKLGKFGLILGRTWELIVNDDLDAFTRIPSQLGVRAREKENEIFWGLILGNPNMADGNPYFDATHGNVGTGLLGIAGLGAGRQAMRLQTDLEGELMNVTPKYLVVPAALETSADQIVSSITPNQNSQANPFGPGGRSSLLTVVEPRLDAASSVEWYLFADKAQLAAAEMALLDGKGPEIFVRDGFEVDGMELKLRYVFGMKLIDHRAAYQSDGIVVGE